MIIGGTLEQRWGTFRVGSNLARVATRLARMADSQLSCVAYKRGMRRVGTRYEMKVDSDASEDFFDNIILEGPWELREKRKLREILSKGVLKMRIFCCEGA